MVQAVENWTCVTGKVLSVTPGEGDGRLHMQLRIDHTRSVEKFPDLMKSGPGDVVAIALPLSLQDPKALHTGDTITLTVRLARGPKLFAHPDWRPGQQLPLC
jgi:hypothetical protein